MAQIVTETQSIIDFLKDQMIDGVYLEICKKIKIAYTKHAHENLFKMGRWKFCFCNVCM
jgi:hypothetical protein